jgi:hypothetical protein
MKAVGGKAVIVEDGRPTFLIINVDEFVSEEGAAPVSSEGELIEKINKEINIWKNRQKEREIRQLEKELLQKESKKPDIEIIEDNAAL